MNNQSKNEEPEQNRQNSPKSLKWFGDKRFWLLKWSDIQIFGIVVIVAGLIYGCIEPFSPPEINSPDTYLVVDGFLNVGNDTSRIELRRTQNTNETKNPVIETGAMLTVESEAGETYSFTEEVSGRYILPPYPFNQSDKYRLRIKTINGQEYLSAYVVVTKSPPIDSIGYEVDPGRAAMVFSVNTHDAQNKTRFYRWKFEETWEYRSAYSSNLEVINGEVVTRKESIYTCWQTNVSTNIMLGSTVKLSSDIIKDLPLNIVPIATNKLYIKYSILMKQYALTQEAFEYWTDLAKTTQGTGSLFDPQPSQVTGNITNTTNIRDLVFGYFSASTEEKKRIVIKPNLGRYDRCEPQDTLSIQCFDPLEDCGLKTARLLLTYYGRRSDSVFVANPICADCRLQGGSITKPTFMDN